MNKKKFIQLLAVTAAITALTLILSRCQDSRLEGESPRSAKLYPGLTGKLNKVMQLSIVSKNDTLTVQRHKDAWQLQEKSGYPVDAAKVRELLIGIGQLEKIESKTSNPEFYSRLAVNTPENASTDDDERTRRVVAIGKDKKELFNLIIGKPRKVENRRSDSQYVRPAAKKQAWLVKGQLSPEVDAMRWVDASIINLTPDSIQKISIQPHGSEALIIEKAKATDKTFTLKNQPEGRTLKSPNDLNVMAQVFQSLSFEDVSKALPFKRNTAKITQVVVHTFKGMALKMELAQKDGDAYVSLITHVETVITPTDESPQADGSLQNDGTMTLASMDTSTQEAHSQAIAIEKRTSGWFYKIPTYKAGSLVKSMDDLLVVEDDVAEKKKPETEEARVNDPSMLKIPVSPRPSIGETE